MRIHVDSKSLFDLGVGDYFDKVASRIHKGESRDSALEAVLKTISPTFHQELTFRVCAAFGTAKPRPKPSITANVQQCPTVRVQLTATGDRNEFRLVRMPPHAQFRPKTDEELCKMTYVMAYVPSSHTDDARCLSTNRNGRKVEQVLMQPPRIGDGDLIYLPTGTFLIRNHGKDFRRLTMEELAWYIGTPQGERLQHPLMRP